MKKLEFYLTLVLSELSLGKQKQITSNYNSINEVVSNGYDRKIQTILSGDEYYKLVEIATSGAIKRHLEGLRYNNMGVISQEDSMFPDSLRHIHEPPSVLYYKGNLSLLQTDCIAIVGSRGCTRYGMEQAKKFAGTLSRAKFTIVSGLAEGVDTYAHLGALESKGNTIAVMAGGLNNIYPAINTNLSKRIVEQHGLLISENVPSFMPKSYSFVQRNRIIAGLSMGVFSPEMGLKSGAMHTINFALDEGKQVFVLPGNVSSSASAGTNNLIKSLQGACVLEPQDIIANFEGHSLPKEESTKTPHRQLSLDEQLILQTLKVQDAHFNELLEKTKMDAKKLTSLLTTMEIRGLIKKLAGNNFGV